MAGKRCRQNIYMNCVWLNVKQNKGCFFRHIICLKTMFWYKIAVKKINDKKYCFKKRRYELSAQIYILHYTIIELVKSFIVASKICLIFKACKRWFKKWYNLIIIFLIAVNFFNRKSVLGWYKNIHVRIYCDARVNL